VGTTRGAGHHLRTVNDDDQAFRRGGNDLLPGEGCPALDQALPASTWSAPSMAISGQAFVQGGEGFPGPRQERGLQRGGMPRIRSPSFCRAARRSIAYFTWSRSPGHHRPFSTISAARSPPPALPGGPSFSITRNIATAPDKDEGFTRAPHAADPIISLRRVPDAMHTDETLWGAIALAAVDVADEVYRILLKAVFRDHAYW